ncbi:MAG: hypothetical protein ACT4O1_07520 [Gemmatimonadota bacterium]
MFGLPTLDVILGLTFIYLLLALACTAFNEMIAQWLNWRPATLKQGIRALLNGPDPVDPLAAHRLLQELDREERRIQDALAEIAGPQAFDDAAPQAAPALVPMLEAVKEERARLRSALLTGELFAHPLIYGLSQARRTAFGRTKFREPSYIPSRLFADALLDIVAPRNAAGPASVQDLKLMADRLPPQIGRPLRIFADRAGSDLADARKQLEKWYEDAMERVSGLYKRKVQLLTIVAALILTAVINADTITLTRSLASDAATRNALASYAEAASKADPANTAATPRAQLAQITATIDTLRGIGLPLGWRKGDFFPAYTRNDDRKLTRAAIPWAGSKLLGLLITALAVSLGAPFWFDMLNKIVNIRSSGRAPEEKPKPPEALPPARGA